MLAIGILGGSASGQVSPLPSQGNPPAVVLPVPSPTVQPVTPTPPTLASPTPQLSVSDALSYVQTLVTILAAVIAFMTLLFGVAGFIGFREISQIWQLERQFNDLIAQTKSAQKEYREAIVHINVLSNEMITNVAKLREEFVQQSRKIIEAAYYFTTGENFYKGGDNARAIENYKIALGYHSDDIGILFRVGRALVNLSRLDEAQTYFEKMLSLDPRSANGCYGLATVWRYKDRTKALEYINQAVALDGNNSEVLNYKGLMCRDAQQFMEAIDAHTKALNISATAITHFYLALLQARQSDIPRAKMHIFSANVLLPDAVRSSAVRDVWAALIQWAVSVFEADKKGAKAQWKKVQIASVSERVNRAVADHVKFLCSALEVVDTEYK
jgi:tetratricopeptide (TPR) repeat protein